MNKDQLKAEALAIIKQIAIRAAKLDPTRSTRNGVTDVEADILKCHENAMPLKLQELLEAPGYDFMHDVDGIEYHLDRESGELKDNFCPRYAE